MFSRRAKSERWKPPSRRSEQRPRRSQAALMERKSFRSRLWAHGFRSSRRMLMNKMVAIALRYAECGWPVFPVHIPTGDPARPCSCRRVGCPQLGKHPCHKNTCKDRGKHPCHKSVCDSVGKHPRTKNGVCDASTDEAKIRRWWEIWVDANIGVATGGESGFFALDVDPRKGGAESLASLEAKHGKLPETLTADTGGCGAHHLFK